MKKEIKKLRANFDSECRKRDGNKCAICGRSNVNLSVHHVMDRKLMPNGGYVVSNGITLCDEPNGHEMSCHMRAEQYHINYERVYKDGDPCGREFPPFVPEGYHPEDLYTKIGSSPEQAWKDSADLSSNDVPRLLGIMSKDRYMRFYYRGSPFFVVEDMDDSMTTAEKDEVYDGFLGRLPRADWPRNEEN